MSKQNVKDVVGIGGKNGTGKGSLLGAAPAAANYTVISPGNLLREARKNGTELGKKAQSYMDAGELVPDSLIISLVLEAIASTDKDVILDGFPRTVPQAHAMLEAGIKPVKFIILEVSDDELLQRAKDRIVCPSCGQPYTLNDYQPPKVSGICDLCGSALIRRKDDEESVVKNRLAVYAEQTAPAFPVLAAAGIPIHYIHNGNARPKGEALAEFNALLTI